MADYSKIPQELRSAPHWLAANVIPDPSRPGKFKKLPKSAKTGDSSEWNSAENLSSFDEAVSFCEAHPNHVLGFAFKDSPYIGIDVDNAFETMGPKDEAAALLQKYGRGFYMERTPSGKGIRIFLKKNGPDDGLSQHLEQQPLGNDCFVEVFIGGFCTVTGNQIGTSFAIAEANPREVWNYCKSLNRNRSVSEPGSGGRNQSLAQYAGKLANKNLTQDEAKLLILARNSTFAEPLAESELQRTVFKSLARWVKTDEEDTDGWRDDCKSFGQLTTEPPRYIIENLIPEKALTFVTAHSFNGKTWFSLQAAWAMAEATPLWGFNGPDKPVPIIYHCPEMNEAMLRDYMHQLGIGETENFLVRPMELGIWSINSPRMLRSSEGRYVFFDTQGFFNESEDGNDYQQSLKFGRANFNLMNAGAQGTCGLAHLAKHSAKSGDSDWTLQNSVIGSAGYGGILRSCLRMTNLNPDLNDKAMWLYVQGMKNPGLKPFQVEGPPPLRMKVKPGFSPYLKDLVPGKKQALREEEYEKAASLFDEEKSQREVADALKVSLGKANTLYQKYKAEKEPSF